MFFLTCYVIKESRRERRRRQEQQDEAEREQGVYRSRSRGDVPPTYSEVVLSVGDPPDYLGMKYEVAK